MLPPEPHSAQPVERPTAQRRRRLSPAAMILAVALLSAAVGSGSTIGMATLIAAAPTDPATAASPAPVDARLTGSTEADDLSAVVESARESVVTVTAQTRAGERFSPFSVPQTGVGSGIVISSDGLILTNNHVVEGARSVNVTLPDGRELSATVVRAEPARDMAILRADGEDLTPATLGSASSLKVGQTVLAIGSPLGEFTETVTRGIVSALDRDITVGNARGFASETLSGLIQTDAAINPGNSGGPLINVAGEVVGINTAVAQSAEGIGFAIPIDSAEALIGSLS